MINMLKPLSRKEEVRLITLTQEFITVAKEEDETDDGDNYNAQDLAAAALFGALARQQLSFLLKHDDPELVAFASKFQEALGVTHQITETFFGRKKQNSDIPSG